MAQPGKSEAAVTWSLYPGDAENLHLHESAGKGIA
jgi:hypothetical protein